MASASDREFGELKLYAERGNTQCQIFLGSLFETGGGGCGGARQDSAAAAAWYRKVSPRRFASPLS
jgi:TPR repeat protein